jgi:hypothetical protein
VAAHDHARSGRKQVSRGILVMLTTVADGTAVADAYGIAAMY